MANQPNLTINDAVQFALSNCESIGGILNYKVEYDSIFNHWTLHTFPHASWQHSTEYFLVLPNETFALELIKQLQTV